MEIHVALSIQISSKYLLPKPHEQIMQCHIMYAALLDQTCILKIQHFIPVKYTVNVFLHLPFLG